MSRKVRNRSRRRLRRDQSGARAIAAKTPQHLLDELCVNTYELVHISVEEQHLIRKRINALSKSIDSFSDEELLSIVQDVRDEIAPHRPNLRRWIENIRQHAGSWVWCWGAASEAAVTDEMRDLIQKIANHLVLRDASCVHGSSVTGYMGVFDAAWASAIEATASRISQIATIPLRWVCDHVREVLSKRGNKKYRCPPHLRVSDRTELFGRVPPTMILVAPGGIGSMFEIFWNLVSGQLKELLLTCYTGNERPLPPMVLLDCKVPETGRWLWYSLECYLQDGVCGNFVKQIDVENVTILRVGIGESVTADDRKGAKIIYCESNEAAAKYIDDLYSSL